MVAQIPRGANGILLAVVVHSKVDFCVRSNPDFIFDVLDLRDGEERRGIFHEREDAGGGRHHRLDGGSE
jgi:hypothetical protein